MHKNLYEQLKYLKNIYFQNGLLNLKHGVKEHFTHIVFYKKAVCASKIRRYCDFLT